MFAFGPFCGNNWSNSPTVFFSTGCTISAAISASGSSTNLRSAIRGCGTVNCGVIIDDDLIGSPLVTQPDVLIAMNGPSFGKFVGTVAPGGKIIVDSSIVDAKADRTDIEIHGIPATQLSKDEGLDGIANIIMLGKMLKESGFSTLETIEKAIEKSVPARKENLIVHNIRAIKLGMSL